MSTTTIRTDDELTSILYCFAPHQMPSRFEIAPLPRKIASWLISPEPAC